jgi:hypothetical protein
VASGAGTAHHGSDASGSSTAHHDSTASGSGLAHEESTSSGAAIALEGSVASGCAIAEDESTASGGDCAPEKEKEKEKAHKARHLIEHHRAEHHGVVTAEAQAVGGAKLALTGLDVLPLAEAAAASTFLGALLMGLGGVRRRRRANP